jgi:hypothetical protein
MLERTEKQWRSLIAKSGLVLEKIRLYDTDGCESPCGQKIVTLPRPARWLESSRPNKV